MNEFENKQTVSNETEASKGLFMAIGHAIALYALLFGICLYKNVSGIMTIIIAAATVACIWYCSRKMGYGERAESSRLYPYYVGIVLLGISICCTADELIITVNYIGIVLLVLSALIRIFCTDTKWGIKKYISVIMELAFSPLQYFARPFQDYKAYRQSCEKRKSDVVKYVILGFIIAIPFMAIVVVLLASADVVFSGIINSILNKIGVEGIELIGNGISFVIMVLAAFLYIYGMAAKLLMKNIDENVCDKRSFEPVIGITFTGMLTFIYLIFSCIQILYLFSNSLKLPDNYTYSEYAREGFFQLLAVAFINLLIVLFCVSFFRRNRVLNVVLTIMSACTYIMIASSAMRMILYISEYALTYLRIQVLLALLMIAVVMAGVIVSIYKEEFPFVHYVILVVGAIWILFSFCRPEYIIAKYNISRFNAVYESENGYKLIDVRYGDMQYLSSLGPDAAPAIYEFVEDISKGDVDILCWDGEYAEKLFKDIKNGWEEKPGIRSFNFSRYKAYKCGEAMEDLNK